MRFLVLALGLAVLPSTAQAMSVGQFLGKVAALKAKGPLALLSSDLGLLKNEMKSVTTDYRADLVAARTAGKPPHSCPPPKGKASFGSDELIAEFEKVPPAQRAATSVKAAFYAMMKRRFPCRTAS